MAQGKPRKLNAQELAAYAVRILHTRALSRGELKDRLQLRAESPEDIDPILSKFKQYGFLNDKKFADAVAVSRLENHGLGKARVLRELRQRRVAPAVAQQSVDAAFQSVNEVELIEAYLARKYRNTNLSEYLADEKHLASAFRRLRYAGFGAGNAILVLKRYAARAEELESIDDGQSPEQ